MITLRPMTMEDANKMLEWKNYPETRKFAIVSHEEINLKDHLKWLPNNLQYFQVILKNSNVCGAVRIQDSEISIWVDRAFWGKNIATDIIMKVSDKSLIAKIVSGNIASMRAFIRAGYKPISYENEVYIFRN